MLSSAAEEWKPGATFFLKIDKSHLWVIITVPAGPEDAFLAVNMTSVSENGPRDPACILNKGDHPFVKHQTEINYDRTLEMSLQGPKGLLANRDYIVTNRPVSAKILNKIQRGAINSRFMKERFKDIIRKEINSP